MIYIETYAVHGADNVVAVIVFRSDDLKVHSSRLCHYLNEYVHAAVHVPIYAHFPNKKHLKNVGPIRHCEPPHAALTFTRCHYCRVARRLRIDVHNNDDDDDNNDNE